MLGKTGDAAAEPSVHDADTARVSGDVAGDTEPTSIEAPAPVRVREEVRQQPRAKSPSKTTRPPINSSKSTVYVVGFWRRLFAGLLDLIIIIPASLIVIWLASKLTGVHVPRGLDFWLDLILASDPALVMALGLTIAVAALYALVFQVTQGRTIGMRVLGMRVVDIYGDSPSAARCVARTLGYLGGVATLLLGFLWIGFDREKRALHDWIAGTYVIRG